MNLLSEVFPYVLLISVVILIASLGIMIGDAIYHRSEMRRNMVVNDALRANFGHHINLL